MRNPFIIAAAFLLVLSAASCKSQYELLLEGNDAQAKYEAAFDYFNQGKYQKSAALFESLSVLTNGTSRDDTGALATIVSRIIILPRPTLPSSSRCSPGVPLLSRRDSSA